MENASLLLESGPKKSKGIVPHGCCARGTLVLHAWPLLARTVRPCLRAAAVGARARLPVGRRVLQRRGGGGAPRRAAVAAGERLRLGHGHVHRSEKDAKLAQKLGQLQPFRAVLPHESWANLYILGQPNTLLARGGGGRPSRAAPVGARERLPLARRDVQPRRRRLAPRGAARARSHISPWSSGYHYYMCAVAR
jgi:hypothetical protein